MSSRRGFLRNFLAGAGMFASARALSAQEMNMSHGMAGMKRKKCEGTEVVEHGRGTPALVQTPDIPDLPVLTHPKYMGCHVFGRTASRLSTPKVNKPTSEWVVTRGSHAGIVDSATFIEAQRLLCERTISKSDAAILEDLRSLLARERRLTLALIQESDLPSPSTYRRRFGSLQRAYELIGYGSAEHFAPCDLRRRIRVQREDLMRQLVALFPHDLMIVRRGGRWRTRLRLRTFD